jgi:3,4-dihydroxy 2-butanone 4-phosphate synthase / GTP cyclohydrolase II
MPVVSIEEAIKEIKDGRMIILTDDEDRENEGDLTMAAEKITPEAINFMAKYGRGLICLSLSPELTDKVGLQVMVKDNTSPFHTAFTASIDARKGISTGLSARDRAATILAAVADDATPDSVVQPGHVFPLRARRGGVLVRTGQTEGSVDLARLAKLKPSGVICEIMNEDGSMSRMPDLEIFAEKHGIKIATVRDIIQYRVRKETLVHRAAAAKLPTPYGEFKAIAYTNDIDDHQHLALVKGELEPDDEVLVRVHSECLTGDVFSSLRCDCGDQLSAALKRVQAEGKGVVLYMHQEGRGIGLINKLKAYMLQDQGKDTVEANVALGFKPDLRDYGIGAQILADLGVRKMRLLTNNPRKIIGLEGYGLTVIERVALEVEPNPENVKYLKTKCAKLGHLIEQIGS